MSGWPRGSLFAAVKAAAVASISSILGWVLVLGAGPALADPDADPAPGDPGVVAPAAPGSPPARGSRLPLTLWRCQLKALLRRRTRRR